MTHPDPDTPPAQPADESTESKPRKSVRTSLTLRPEVHDYFRQRAIAKAIRTGTRASVHQLIVDLCEGAFHEWSQMEKRRSK